MAIRQSDERFIMNKVWPGLVKAEALLLAQDRATDLRYDEEQEWPVTAALTGAIDALALRIDRQSGLGSWRSVKDRIAELQERCPHDQGHLTTGGGVKTKEDGTTYSILACALCDKKKENIIEESAA